MIKILGLASGAVTAGSVGPVVASIFQRDLIAGNKPNAGMG